jgi:hypothetical protein
VLDPDVARYGRQRCTPIGAQDSISCQHRLQHRDELRLVAVAQNEVGAGARPVAHDQHGDVIV